QRQNCGPHLGAEFGLRTIAGLGKRVGPAAIGRRIGAVIVYAVEALAGRTFAHIGDEIADIVPALAYCDSSAAVAGIFLVFLVVTAAHHAPPRWVQRMAPMSVAELR